MRVRENATKVVLLGSSSVGKTSIIRQLVSSELDDICPTMGANYQTLTLPDNQGGTVLLHVWDTAGEERFASVLPMYLRGVAIAVLVCATDPAESVGALDRWLSVLRESQAPLARVCVVLNKIDLEPEFDAGRARKWAETHGFPLFVISALQKADVDRVFGAVAEIAATIAAPVPVAAPSPKGARGDCCL
jgi:small GTP-binding protein